MAPWNTEAVPPPPHDEIDVDVLDAGVKFIARSEQIHQLWDSAPPNFPYEAQRLSTELVRDSITWRYPEADHAYVIPEYSHNEVRWSIAEIRDLNDHPIAWDELSGGLEPATIDYSEILFIDNALIDELWPFLCDLAQQGSPGPQVPVPTRVDTNILKGHDGGIRELFRLELRAKAD
ncbi:hypothetical protein CQ018_02960 [Arthrobacter sp. MYb227]|uniref:hypothetical protein n=1 Tax=Arthrobacter sp. MYb227 TaxID=1848601 RepID=UPI000CFC3222|nr:hypothetical protein [Arthrobacter sp. MYb227]PQZ96250.1 hypothetical protein CQ018_02960 [Arthrobacter sp. MYb227]